LSNLAFNGIPLALVIDELLLLGGYQLRIVLRPSQRRAASTDSMTLTESSIGAGSVDLVSTDHFRVMTVTAAIGHCLSLEVFSFVVGVITQAIEKSESLAADRD